MLVAISDLHIAYERTAINVPQGAFDVLERETLANAADRKASEIHLVLLGDIFDLVPAPDYWHRKTRDGTLPVAKRPLERQALADHRHEPRPGRRAAVPRHPRPTFCRRTAPSRCWR